MSQDELPSVEFFARHVGEVFEIAIEGRAPYRLELAEAIEMAGDSDARDPFSVLFRATDEMVLPQRTYRLDHGRLGPIDLFLVPLGPEKGGDGALLYEAAFS